MTSDKEILGILQEQVNTYKKLHSILKKERESLVNIEPDKVEEISKEKDTIVMRLRLLEEERQRLTKQYTVDNALDGEINLDGLGKHTGNRIFPELRSQMISLLQSIEEMNRFNSILIDRSLNHIKTTTNFFNIFNADNMPQSTGVLLSKET